MADAIVTGLSRWQQDNHDLVPNMIGSICFLVASYLAYAGVSQGTLSFASPSVSRWIIIINQTLRQMAVSAETVAGNLDKALGLYCSGCNSKVR